MFRGLGQDEDPEKETEEHSDRGGTSMSSVLKTWREGIARGRDD